MKQDVSAALQQATRVTRCMRELYLEGGDAAAVRNSILLDRCLKARSWEDSVTIFRQLKAIGVSYMRTFASKGVKTFSDLRNTEPECLELWCHRSSPFGREVLDDLERIPTYDLKLIKSPEIAITGDGDLNFSLIVKLSVTNGQLDDFGTKRSANFGWTTFLADANGVVIEYQRFRYVIYMFHSWQNQ